MPSVPTKGLAGRNDLDIIPEFIQILTGPVIVFGATLGLVILQNRRTSGEEKSNPTVTPISKPNGSTREGCSKDWVNELSEYIPDADLQDAFRECTATVPKLEQNAAARYRTLHLQYAKPDKPGDTDRYVGAVQILTYKSRPWLTNTSEEETMSP